tara:strand:+ start:1148 stop:1426 length:279 start_codon:yes stop_codon:yes gene_type:complete
LILDSDVLLMDLRANSTGIKPSTDAAIHAWLLTLPNVNFVVHAYPVSVNQILCSKQAKVLAKNRLFSDQMVSCQKFLDSSALSNVNTQRLAF